MNPITSSVNRVGSSTRPVMQSSDVDIYDEVPSPRASPSYMAASKRAQANGKNGRVSVPSRLSQSMMAEEDESDVDTGAPIYDYGDFSAPMEIDDSPPPMPQSARTPQASRTPRQTPRRTSFTNLAQEADEPGDDSIEDGVGAMGEEPIDYYRPPSAKARGKQRASYVQEDDGMDGTDIEPEIAQGLDDVELDPIPEEDGPMDAEPPSPPKKKSKENKAAKNSRKENDGVPRGRSRAKKEVLREGAFSLHLIICLISHLQMLQSRQRKTRMVFAVASAGSTLRSHGGGLRRSCMGVGRMAPVLCQASRKSTESRK